MTTEQKGPTPEQLATGFEESMKNWKRASEALETCTFHGRYAREIAGLIEFSKVAFEKDKQNFEKALDQIKTPKPAWNKPEAVGAAQ